MQGCYRHGNERTGNMLSFFDPNSDLVREIDIPMDRAEGVAFNSSTNIVYIVDENESKLYSYLLDVKN